MLWRSLPPPHVRQGAADSLGALEWPQSLVKYGTRRREKFNFLVKYGTRRREKFNSLVKYVSLEGRQIHLGTQEAPEPLEGLGGPLCSDSVSKQCLGGYYVTILCQSNAWEAVM